MKFKPRVITAPFPNNSYMYMVASQLSFTLGFQNNLTRPTFSTLFNKSYKNAFALGVVVTL